MPLGYDQEIRVVNLNDTADLRAVLYDDDDSKPRNPDDLVSVEFVVQLPDETQTSITGTLADDGTGCASFNGTTAVGHYVAVATFTDVDDRRKSVRTDFDVIDPFITTPPSASYLVATQIWSKIEDCFDADEEGPWLRDVTLNTFNREKMESFLDLALFDINQLNPPTTLALNSFTVTDSNTGLVSSTSDTPLLVQGGFIVCLRHLMTSYVEQPAPTGAQIAWQDRRDYLTRWGAVYAIEFPVYDRMAKLYKRRYLGLGTTKGLISSKAGRMIAAPMRSQFIGRGFW